MAPNPRSIFGMLTPETVFGCSPGIGSLSWLSPGPRTNARWRPALLIAKFVFGMSPQESVYFAWRIIGPMPVRCTLADRGSAWYPDREMALSGCGNWQPARCCKNSEAIGMGFMTLCLTRVRPESYQEAGIVRSGYGNSARGNASN